MSEAPRVLLLTPDYPAARGAIEHVLRGIAQHASRVQLRVLTQRGAVARLNAAALAETRSWQPDVVLSGHIVTAPAARLSRAPFVQYLYASEMADRPHLTSFAMRHASASIVVGELGRSLALAAGADDRRIHIIPPGIDLPAPPTTTPREREPLIVSVAGLESRHKGLEVLIRALPLIRSRVPAASMTLVGGACRARRQSKRKKVPVGSSLSASIFGTAAASVLANVSPLAPIRRISSSTGVASALTPLA